MPEELFEALSRLAAERGRLLTREAAIWIELGELLRSSIAHRTAPTAPRPAKTHAEPKPDRLLRVNEVAEFLSMSAATLNKWRVTGGGPEFVKVGRRILYRRDTIEKFIASKTKPHTSAYELPPKRSSRR